MKLTSWGLIAAAASFAAATTLFAGGWAVVTVDSLPEYAEAGESLTLGYTVRQHGQHLIGGLSGRLEARAGAREVVADARPGRYAGHYVATLTLPAAGEWSLTIQSGFGEPAVMPLRVVAPGTRPAPLAASERGRQLFVAKGCVTCHRVDGDALATKTQFGPVLVPHKYQAEYLARILANPALIPPVNGLPFRMPNLGLDTREIEALAAFINHRPTSHTNTSAQR